MQSARLEFDQGTGANIVDLFNDIFLLWISLKQL